MQIRPIRNEADHTLAVKRIEALMGARPGSTLGDEVDILATLVVAYEEEHHAIRPPDPVDAILFVMEQRGLKRQDLEPMIGSRARVSEVLGRKRNLTLPMIRRLHVSLNIPAESLIGAAAKKRKVARKVLAKKAA